MKALLFLAMMISSSAFAITCVEVEAQNPLHLTLEQINSDQYALVATDSTGIVAEMNVNYEDYQGAYAFRADNFEMNLEDLEEVYATLNGKDYKLRCDF